MQDHPEPKKPRRKVVSKDIGPVLEGWDYENGTINVRKVTGADGLAKVQMRLDLGLLQMEVDGRPDGRRPHGHESLLEFHEDQLAEHCRRNGTELGFHLTPNECQSLREEAVMYYHRYLSMFVLGEFPAVARDTERNLRVLELCGKYAEEEQDRLILEQYRPYILMMHGRARASLELNDNYNRRALATIRRTLGEIRRFFARFGHEQAFRHAPEVKILKRFAREIRRRIPEHPVRKLQRLLKKAVRAERYEEAAQLRDQIERLQGTV